MLSLLIGANAGSSPQTEHAIDFPAVVPFIQQSPLHFVYVVGMRDRWRFFTEFGYGSEWRRAGPRNPRRQQQEDDPGPRGSGSYQHFFSSICAPAVQRKA
jgi:hypothetical protein